MLGPVAASAPALTDVLALFWLGTHNHQPSLLQGTFSPLARVQATWEESN